MQKGRPGRTRLGRRSPGPGAQYPFGMAARGRPRWWRDAVAAIWSAISPVWKFNTVLGPLGTLLWLVGALVIGLAVSLPGWGLATFFGVFSILAVCDIVKRLRRDRERVTAEMELLGRCHGEGEMHLSWYCTTNCMPPDANATDEEVLKDIDRVTRARKTLKDWQSETERQLRDALGDHVALLFRAHPEVKHSRTVPSDLPTHAEEAFHDAANRLEWLAARLGTHERQRNPVV